MTPTLTPTPPESRHEITYCRHCGTPAEDGAIYCRKCGSALLPSARLIDSNEAPAESVAQVRPWVRYWARIFDLTLYAFVFAILIGMVLPATTLEKINNLALQMLILFAWVFVESLLLAVVNTTPGKALFRIHLRLQGCDSIPFLNAFYRSLRVWWRGWGTGFPLVSIFTLWHAEFVLSRDGITSWDKEGGFQVRHEKIGVFRVTVGVVFLVLAYGLILFETFKEAQPLAVGN